MNGGPPSPLGGLLDTTNPYFSAGAGLFVLGGGATLLRGGWKYGAAYFQRNFMVKMEIPSKDPSYSWVLNWITARAARQTQHLSVETFYQKDPTGRIKTSYNLIPSTGRHFIKHKGYWMVVERAREKAMVDLTSGTPWETVTFTTYGRNRELFLDILQEARDMALAKEEGKTLIYTANGFEWKEFGQPRARRPLSSVILDGDQAERLAGDVKEFLANQSWYRDRGIPYRRGYLLYGPPGSGKSSFITALAGELQYNICMLNLSERGMTDDKLAYMMSIVPTRSITVLEDVDAAAIRREQPTREYQSCVTFSGLLNVLDGVASSEERLLFMTTNHIDRLDPALIRPGRVDVKLEMGNASADQVRRMFLRFYPDHERSADEFVARVEAAGKPVSMAQLQGHFMLFKEQPHNAVSNAELLSAE